MHLLKICISQLSSLPDGQIRQLAHCQLAQPILFYSSGWIEVIFYQRARKVTLPTFLQSSELDVWAVINHYKEFNLLRGGGGGDSLGLTFPSLPGMRILLQLAEMTVGVARLPHYTTSLGEWGFYVVYWYTLPNYSTTYKIQSSTWVPAIVFKICFLSYDCAEKTMSQRIG